MLSGQTTKDYGTFQRHQHDIIELIYVTEMHSRTAKVQSQRQVDRYFMRRLITKKEYDIAGEMYALWRATGLSPGLTSSYKERVEAQKHMSTKASDAFMYLSRVFHHIGHSAQSVLLNVVVWDMSTQEWARLYGLPGRSGMSVFKLALRDFDKVNRALSK